MLIHGHGDWEYRYRGARLRTSTGRSPASSCRAEASTHSARHSELKLGTAQLLGARPVRTNTVRDCVCIRRERARVLLVNSIRRRFRTRTAAATTQTVRPTQIQKLTSQAAAGGIALRPSDLPGSRTVAMQRRTHDAGPECLTAGHRTACNGERTCRTRGPLHRISSCRTAGASETATTTSPQEHAPSAC